MQTIYPSAQVCTNCGDRPARVADALDDNPGCEQCHRYLAWWSVRQDAHKGIFSDE